jgi:hypothetical protein
VRKVYLELATKHHNKGVISLQMRRARRNNDEGSIWDFLAGLAMGVIGYSVLSSIVKPACPNPTCGRKIERGTPRCQYCNTDLEWK